MGYRVSGEYAYVTVGDDAGNGVVQLLGKGQIVPGAVSARVLEHLVFVGLVEEFEDESDTPEAEVNPGVDADSDDDAPDLEELDLNALRAIAKDEDIDLSNARAKADIIAAITAARA